MAATTLWKDSVLITTGRTPNSRSSSGRTPGTRSGCSSRSTRVPTWAGNALRVGP